jgi:hypothetical protein
MGRFRGTRTVLAVGFALALMVSGSQSVVAYRILVDCTGTCAFYELYDEMDTKRGAHCLYEAANPGDLDVITVRPPQMHGLATAPAKSKVQWRFHIRRQAPGGSTFVAIHKSSWQTSKANDQEVANAGDGFSRRRWVAPENVSGFYQVVVQLRWWLNGSQQGRVTAQYEWYKAKRSGNSYINNEYCLEEY